MQNIRIYRQSRRNMQMKVTPVGLVVFIPLWLELDDPQLDQFIAEGVKKLGKRIPNVEQSSPAEIRERVALWAGRVGVQPKRVQLREMYQKWGSCSRRGTITLNIGLCRLPPDLAEYVILHEVVHLRVFNHGAEFKALMSAQMPDWEAREQRLDAVLGTPGKSLE